MISEPGLVVFYVFAFVVGASSLVYLPLTLFIQVVMALILFLIAILLHGIHVEVMMTRKFIEETEE